MTKMNIPFSPPDISDLETANVVDTLKSGWITTGPKTKEFERKIADFCNTSKAVTFNSATAAMEITLRMLGVGPGDEVITSAYTYTASASVIYHVGAKIVLVDTQKDSLEMDYEELADKITERTKVIIPVDIAGKMIDYDKLFATLESKKHLYQPKKETLQENFNRPIVLADGAHSFGAKYKGKMSGEVADFTAFSFHAVKNLTTGEGGAVTWRDIDGIGNDELYRNYMLYILHGQSKDALAKNRLGGWEYDIIEPLYKFNMTDIASAIGLGQLERFPGMLERRRELIEEYNFMFKGLNLDYLKHYDDSHVSSGHLYMIRLNGYTRQERDDFIIKMAEAGIATNVHYKPLPLFTAYKNLGFDIKDYPNAYNYFSNEVTLPLYSTLTDEQLEYVASHVQKLLSN